MAGLSCLIVVTSTLAVPTEAELLAGDPLVEKVFGTSVAISSGRVLVGAPGEHVGPGEVGGIPGAAYVFALETGVWTETAKLMPSISMPGDGFGVEVALDGDVAVIGALCSMGEADIDGRAFIFRRSEGGWVEEAVLERPGLLSFGRAVTVSGNTVAVTSRTRVCVYAATASGWQLQGEFSSGAGRWFESVSVDGDMLIAGACHATSGAVYTYTRSGNDWDPRPTIVMDGSPHFGGGVSLSGNRAAVGSYWETIEDLDIVGSVYVFEWVDGDWLERERFLPAVVNQGLYFGLSVSLDGDHLVVGCRRCSDYKGAFYLYRFYNNSWHEVASEMTASDAVDSDRFGKSVDIDAGGLLQNGMIVVGAPGHAHGIHNQGAAYVYHNLIPHEKVEIDPKHFRIMAKVLVGVTQGGGGLLWVPGEGIVPIDPDPLKFLESLSPAERDVVIGLAVRELGAMASDPETRSALEAAGSRVIKDAVARFERQ
jgi:hypothetical protein